MKNLFALLLFLFVNYTGFTQAAVLSTDNPKFDRVINRYLDYTVPLISVYELSTQLDNVLLLDAREPEEYEVSHIHNAKYIGYDHPDFSCVESIDKDMPIVVYCSIGVRSEKIGEQLKEQGFTNVRNLYGSIFEWVNQSHPVYTGDQKVKSVHGYSWLWKKWVSNPEYEIIH